MYFSHELKKKINQFVADTSKLKEIFTKIIQEK